MPSKVHDGAAEVMRKLKGMEYGSILAEAEAIEQLMEVQNIQPGDLDRLRQVMGLTNAGDTGMVYARLDFLKLSPEIQEFFSPKRPAKERLNKRDIKVLAGKAPEARKAKAEELLAERQARPRCSAKPKSSDSLVKRLASMATAFSGLCMEVRSLDTEEFIDVLGEDLTVKGASDLLKAMDAASEECSDARRSIAINIKAAFQEVAPS